MPKKKVATKQHPQNNEFTTVQTQINSAVIAKKEQLEAQGYNVPSISISLKDHSRSIFKPEIKFTKLYEKCLKDIEKEHGLSTTEKGIIITLISHIGYESNLLCHKDGTAVKKKDFCDLLDMGHNAVDQYIKSLVDKGVLAKVQVKRSVNFFLNPYIAYRGSKIDNTLKDMFKHTVR